MFKNSPKILSHISALDNNNFVVSEYILNKVENSVNLFNRFCPHRMYPLADPGTHTDDITCKFHGFRWDATGLPINNNKKLGCGNATVGRSGLVFKNFVEPDHRWVDDLAKEKNLKYSHTCTGSSTGSSLWMMEIQTDLLHIKHGGVHPRLSTLVDLNDVQMEEGDNWVLQTHKDGWWLIVYPWAFVEWSPGCLGINTVSPRQSDNEFGFEWTTQFYFDPTTSKETIKEFITLENVFKEDVEIIEKQKGSFRPLMHSVDRLEEHCVHFGQWVRANTI